MKRKNGKIKIPIGLLVVCFLVACLCVVGIFFVVRSLGNYWAAYPKIKTREDIFRTVLEHQEEYEEIVRDMEVRLQESGERGVDWDRPLLYCGWGGNIAAEEGVSSITALDYSQIEGRGESAVYFDCPSPHPNNGIVYWGFYYSPEDIPPKGWGNVEVREENGVYYQTTSYGTYVAEKITDHWYYREERRRRASDSPSLYE